MMKDFLQKNIGFFQSQKLKMSIPVETKRKFYYMLKFYINTKINILDIFDLIYEDIHLYNIIEVKKHIKNGISLVEALRKFCFTDEFIYACLNVGENTGDYLLALNKIVEYLDNKIANRKYYTQAFSYPVFLLIFANLVFCFLLFFIVPQLYNTLTTINANIPMIIGILYNLSNFVRANFFSGLILIFIALYLIIKNRGNRKVIAIRNFIFKIKIVQNIYNIQILKGVFWQLNILNTYGIDIISALEIVNSTIKSNSYKNIFNNAIEDLKQGSSLYQSLKKYEIYFPKAVLEYVKLGEDTSALNENLKRIIEFLEIKTNDFSAYFKQLAQPIVIIFIGFFVLGILMFIIPMIDAITSLGGV